MKEYDEKALDNHSKMRGLYPEYSQLKQDKAEMYFLLGKLSREALGFYDKAVAEELHEALKKFKPRGE